MTPEQAFDQARGIFENLICFVYTNDADSVSQRVMAILHIARFLMEHKETATMHNPVINITDPEGPNAQYKERNMSENGYLTDLEVAEKCFEIIETLGGVCMRQALHILEEAARLMKDAHIVNIESARYTTMKEETLKYLSSCA